MKENNFCKLYNHPDRDEIVAKLTLGITIKDINEWLKSKYDQPGTKSFVLNVRALTDFKEEYLDLYNTIRNDALQLRASKEENTDPVAFVQNNSIYRQKLEEYLDKEIDLKQMLKNMIVAVEHRVSQIYDIIQKNPANTKPDYVLIQWLQTLANILEKQETILNGNSDKIIQQNNFNIQIVDQHINVFQKVIRDVLSRLDYDTSMLFIELFNEEIKKIKQENIAQLPIEVRLEEADKLKQEVSLQLEQ